RVVHFDLKGAPPKIEYFDWLFPMLKRWGATGVLMEYEDMFPYNGKWSVLRQPHAYGLEDVRHIEEVAGRNDLHIIPLIQTFGHLEFLLKHDVCASIREVPSSPQALCPLNEQSIVVVGELMQQVISAHRHIKYFHIGADEVGRMVNLGHCPRCRQTGDTTTLFFHHVRRVLNYLTQFRPDLHIIMWDDMFREVDVLILEAAGIGDLVQPMVWMYTPQLHFPEGMWERYMKVFSKLWVASAFKGASGVNQRATPISHHIENNKGWLFKMEFGEEQGVSCKFVGYAITGWSRYDHYQMLCELLPVGLPSLALCLLTLTHG
ncbi:hypothetical protein HELRODRAFT_121272, partial [Helobdella robusta]|uniref:beta-N-acetylhexosaminidase n=1 Tax=Helobdella robusta TaxID=6412 RepID=T1EGR2_HELRO